MIEVGYLIPGQEREATELFAAVASERQWIGTEGPLDIEARTAGLVGSIACGQQTLIVARLSGRIVGTLGLYRDTKGPRTISLGMMVAADRRAMGVGSALIDFAVAHARSAGYEEIALDVFPHNEAARALYRKFGFVEVERVASEIPRANGDRWDVIRCKLMLRTDETATDGGTTLV